LSTQKSAKEFFRNSVYTIFSSSARFSALEARGKVRARRRSAEKYGKTGPRQKNGVDLDSEKFFGTFRRAQSFISLEGAIAILGPLPLARWRR
jgi:DNA-directed RNA polymerase specialized sigma24 family protein